MDKIIFQDLPNETTPINATNLNLLQTNIDNAMLQNKGTIPNGTNCNNLTNSGIYLFNGSSTILNAPPNFGVFEVLKTSNLYILQRCSSSNTSSMRISYDNGSTWNDWIKLLPETITNSNGTAVKFPDGTMICRGTYALDEIVSSQSGAIYYSSGYTHNFPANFVENPQVSVAVRTGNLAWPANVNSSPSLLSFSIIQQNSQPRTGQVAWMAIGRWK